MSNLPLVELKPEIAFNRDFKNMDITLKLDGTLIYYKDGKLFSPRCERSERFSHILNALKENNMPNCFGEVFIENGCVFDVSRSENWKKTKFSPIDLEDKKLSYPERKVLLKQLVSNIKNEAIKPLTEFKDFKEGWRFVEENKAEGLVIRNENNWFKVKKLQEAKVEIKEHIAGSEKGTFILADNNRISGTSREFVRQFNEIKSQGKIPIMELEYAFKTEAGSYFQPRARRIITQEQLNEEHIKI